MSRTKGTYTLTSNIEPKVGAPLDARTIVKLKTDLTANNTFDYPYIGLSVFVREDNKRYTLIGIDPTVAANWREEGSGTSTSADHVTYDNTTSELESTNVQDAIDEVVGSLGTAASKDYTDQVTEDSADLVTSGAVYDALENLPTEDTKVTQTATTTNANYEILFSETADNTTRTEGARKAATLRFNPSKGSLMEGDNTSASGSYSHAEGAYTCASGAGAHAEGRGTTANGQYSHAEGGYTLVSGNYSHAGGQYTTASGQYSHAAGYYTCASGNGAHAEGGYSTNTYIGKGTYATNDNAHAEGLNTTASGKYSHAEGSLTQATSWNAHSEGADTVASGRGAHAEGSYSTASGDAAHAEGGYASSGPKGTLASGINSHAEGFLTTATGDYSHAAGQGTSAAGIAQTVVGKFNMPDTTSLFIVGNGTNNYGPTRSNALKVSSDGTTTLGASGTITSGNSQAVTGGAVYTALGNKLDASLKGAANGVAELDSAGKVPSSQLPSYVDDVIEVEDYAHLPITGVSGKIYVTLDTNLTYRWSGTGYTEISASLALGETSSTAYRGDRGKTAYNHATETKLSTATASGLYKVAGTAQGHVASLTAVTKADITALGIPGSDTNTHRPIQVNGTQNLGDNTTPLNLKNGTNITVTADGGNVTIATSAEVNQNAFSNVKVGSTTVAADSKTDTLELVAGSNVTITPDATNDKITIAATDTKYTAATAAPGNIASSGAVGTSTNYARQDHTHGISVATGDSNGQVKIAGQNASVKGLAAAAYKGVATTVTSGGTDLVTAGAVYTAIDNLPEPMVFKGSLGTGGTVTALPVDGTATIGDTYKVITAGTYASQAAKVGDTFICDSKTSLLNTWVLIPSGDEPSGTVTNVAVSNGGGLSVSGSPITTSGTITISHADTSSQASVSNTGRTYIQSVTLDTYGHVTKLTSATETVTNTDRYVNSASFAHDSTNNNVKMTLTRAGSDTATVTGNIPLVSSSTAGVAPKGAAVSSQSQSTKFLREDGTWAAPSYTTDTNTHRPIQVNGTEILGNNTTALNLKAGSNVSLTNSSGTVTIVATDTNNRKSFYGTCETAAATAAKVVTLADTAGWELKAGTIVGIKCTNSNTAGNATLNVNGSGNKSIFYEGAVYTGSTSWITGQAGRVIFYMYDGTYWVWMNFNWHSDGNNTVTQNATTTNADYEILFSATADNTTRTEQARKNDNFKFNPSLGKMSVIGLGKSWLDTGKNPQMYLSKPSTDGAVGALGIDTKDGRIVIGAYPSANNQLTFSYFTNTTLTGTNNKTDKQMFWEADDDDLHVTKINNVTVGSSPKFTDTTYTLATGDSNGQIKVTPSSGDAYNVAVKGLGSNAYTSTAYLPLTGGTMTGDIIFNKTGATDLTQVQMKCGVNDYGRVAAGGTASNSGWMEIATADDGAEPIYARQYSGVYSSIVRTATLLDASGNTSFPGKLTVSKAINELLTGTGTAAQDKGSGVSPRYFPARWTFNIGIATPADGDIITIKIPVAGHDFGVFLSLDNGTTYKPISVDYGTGRLTTHYAVSRPITLIYDASGGTNSVYAAAGADARSNITGGCWRVMNFWDSGNTYDRNRFNANIMAWGTKILNGNIIVGINGLYHHLKEGTAFDITYPILYLAGDCNASAATTNTYDIIHFTSTTTQNTSWTAYKPVYIKGSLSGNTFTPISTTPLLQTVPTSEDNYYYMLLGIATATNTIYLQERHPIFAYRHNQFAEITWNSQFTSFLKPVAANTTASFSNWGIPSGSYQVWGQRWTDNRLKYTPSGGSETTITDSGDLTMWLTGSATANTATLNMRIDGTFYASGGFNGNLSGNASSATSATKATQDSDGNAINTTYLKKSGGTMTGSVSCTTSGANLTWGNITIYGGGSDGGKNSMVIGNDAIIGDCNVGGYFGIRPNASGGTNAGIRLFNNAGTMIGGFGSNNGIPKWIDASGTEHQIGFYTATPTSGQILVADGTGGGLKTSGYTIATSVPSGAVFTDTKNTAGSTDTSSKIFLIGATSQAANPQTYSDNEVYATSGVLTTKSVQVGGTAATMQYNSTNHCIDFIVT